MTTIITDIVFDDMTLDEDFWLLFKIKSLEIFSTVMSSEKLKFYHCLTKNYIKFYFSSYETIVPYGCYVGKMRYKFYDNKSLEHVTYLMPGNLYDLSAKKIIRVQS